MSNSQPHTTRVCPHCHSPAISRSRIRGGLLGRTTGWLFGIRPYRCLDCWHRFFIHARGAAAQRS